MVEEIPQDQILLAEQLELLQDMQRIARQRPCLNYKPHDYGQRQFHESKHLIRALFPCNRWGKSEGASQEAEVVLQGDRVWSWAIDPAETPAQVMWLCPEFSQFEKLQPQFEARAFTRGFEYNGQKHRYVWPNGSELWCLTGEGDPHSQEGINPTLVIVDENCPLAWWRMLRGRGFGRRRTRYVVSCTPYLGLTWMYHELYLPWLKFHEKLGLTEAQAMEQQLHPEIWCWPSGIISDNPAISPDQATAWAALTWENEKVKKVRDRGGFMSLAGDMVFDSDTLLENLERADDSAAQSVTLMMGAKSVTALSLDEWALELSRKSPIAFAGVPSERGRISVFDHPEERREYVVGADFALGIEGRDYDTACVFDITGDRHAKPVQVCEVQGRWPNEFDRVLYALVTWYNGAFLVGERQFGLNALRSIMSYGHTHLYYDRREESLARPLTDKLGHAKTASRAREPLLLNFRKDFKERKVVLRSASLLRQMMEMIYQPKRVLDYATDENMDIVLTGGGSPDMVMAAMYGLHGAREVHRYEKIVDKPVPKYAADELAILAGRKRR